MNNLLILMTTCFGIGYCPVLPGTVATVLGIGLAFLLAPSVIGYWAVLAVLFFIGVKGSELLEKSSGIKDPGFAVIDEVVGVMIALAGLPITLPIAICGFFLFRAFDMFKIYPVNKFEAMPGGWGIMLDDVMAGLYTNIALHVAWMWVFKN